MACAYWRDELVDVGRVAVAVHRLLGLVLQRDHEHVLGVRRRRCHRWFPPCRLAAAAIHRWASRSPRRRRHRTVVHEPASVNVCAMAPVDVRLPVRVLDLEQQGRLLAASGRLSHRRPGNRPGRGAAGGREGGAADRRPLPSRADIAIDVGPLEEIFGSHAASRREAGARAAVGVHVHPPVRRRSGEGERVLHVGRVVAGARVADRGSRRGRRRRLPRRHRQRRSRRRRSRPGSGPRARWGPSRRRYRRPGWRRHDTSPSPPARCAQRSSSPGCHCPRRSPL